MSNLTENQTPPAAKPKSPDASAAFRAQPPPKRNGSKLGYTRRELAESLGVSIRSIARAEGRGRIRSLKTWRTKLYPHSEVQRFLREEV